MREYAAFYYVSTKTSSGILCGMTHKFDGHDGGSDQDSVTSGGHLSKHHNKLLHKDVRRYGALSVGAQAAGTIATGSLAIGALAVGAVAIGALAIGRLAIKRLTVKRSRIDRLEIDELAVRRLKVEEVIITKRYVVPDDDHENY